MERNSFFIKNTAERVERGESSSFLNTNELSAVVGLLKKRRIKHSIYYPYKMAEKVLVYLENKPEISVLEIITKNELKHSDILGSLFANQISQNQYGDILIFNDKYYITVLTHLVPYFLTSFNKVGNWEVEVEVVGISKIADFEYKYETLQFLTSSLRIDNVVSSITNLSRARVEEMFDDKLVLLQHEIVKRFRVLNEGDIISIRKYGKYKFNGVISKNAKGKLWVEILKYI